MFIFTSKNIQYLTFSSQRNSFSFSKSCPFLFKVLSKQISKEQLQSFWIISSLLCSSQNPTPETDLSQGKLNPDISTLNQSVVSSQQLFQQADKCNTSKYCTIPQRQYNVSAMIQLCLAEPLVTHLVQFFHIVTAGVISSMQKIVYYCGTKDTPLPMNAVINIKSAQVITEKNKCISFSLGFSLFFKIQFTIQRFWGPASSLNSTLAVKVSAGHTVHEAVLCFLRLSYKKHKLNVV